jgi:hypothetical protein
MLRAPKLLLPFVLFLLPALPAGAQTGGEKHIQVVNGTVSGEEAGEVYMTRRIPLQHAQKPVVSLRNPVYAEAIPRPSDSTDLPLKVWLSIDRKKPYALVAIPVRTNKGQKQLRSYELLVEEAPAAPLIDISTAAKTTAFTAPLASGEWHKIAVNAEGFCRIDYDFLKSKLNLEGTVPSAQIQLLGNGGAVLPEKNEATLKNALPENALWMQDGGDGQFGPGDYFVFWGPGPQSWTADSAGKTYAHRKNIYEDRSYYFLTVKGSNGRRITAQAPPPAGTVTDVTSYDYHTVLDEDKYNLGRMGKQWVGDEFSSGSKSYAFDFSGGISPLTVRCRVSARFNGGVEKFTMAVNGTAATPLTLYPNWDLDYAKSVSGMITSDFPVSGNSANVTLNYIPAANISRGYLDYIEVLGRRQLSYTGGFLRFSDWQSVDSGVVAQFRIQNANGAFQVWDVTDVESTVRMTGTLNGSEYNFTAAAGKLRQYAAFNGSSFTAPDYVAKIPSQNLLDQSGAEYLIVTYPDFLPAANKLADWHRQRSGMRVLVATTTQVYNEFSSGGQDVSGIRNFVRYYYDRAGTDTTQMPKYLMLLGDASYDYKNRIDGNTNYVPAFEAAESNNGLAAYTADDFYAFLDAGENIEGSEVFSTLDIGVGRLPAKSLDEAQATVAKIMHYKKPATLGPWRISFTNVADNEDGAGPHLLNAETMDATIHAQSVVFNDTKIYLDNLPIISTPGGTRAPQVNALINNQIFRGTQLMNYNGHGGTREWAHERILTADDYNRWRNMDKLPFFVTATCDFAQFDRPDFVSAGEQLILKGDGGAIALLTTTQPVYSNYAKTLNSDYLKAQFEQQMGKDWRTFGEALRVGKNETYATVAAKSPTDLLDFRKFSLLGDPALTPNLPAKMNAVVTDSLVENATGLATTQLSALGEYSLKGSVTDGAGTLDPTFNGRVYVTVYDKLQKVDIVTIEGNQSRVYQTQNNIVFRGGATVTGGRFSVPFVVPKDLNYNLDTGFVQYYVENGVTDAAGMDKSLRIGGSSDYPVNDEDVPVVRAFIGDSLFRDGGLTGSNTSLYAILEDGSGINVSGNSLGHDLTAILDGDEKNPYILNDYYESASNTYKRGYVRFPVEGLSEGLHTFTVKAWDVANNSGTGSVRFRVGKGGETQMEQLSNYPNPFSTSTRFRFEHNHPNEEMKAEIAIYNVTGGLVRRISETFVPTGSHSQELVWDGTSDGGALLPSGVYVYRLFLSVGKNTEAAGYQKLVITR